MSTGENKLKKKTYIKQQQQKPEEGVDSTIYPQDSFADYTARMKPCSAHLHESGLPVLWLLLMNNPLMQSRQLKPVLEVSAS